MSKVVLDDPVLKRFRVTVDAVYGERLERAVLYGSRARGDARSDSDYDIAVFLHDMPDRWAELNRLAVLGCEIMGDTGEVVHAMAFAAGAYRERTPIMHEVRLDGVDF